LTLKNAISVPV